MNRKRFFHFLLIAAFSFILVYSAITKTMNYAELNLVGMIIVTNIVATL